MTQSEPDAEAKHNGRSPPMASQRVVADPRKFYEYVLVPNHPTGTDRIFLGGLGYRPRSVEDATTLADLYMAQAKERLAQGDYTVVGEDEHGRRYMIEVEVRSVRLRSGWILRADGTLWLATPFTGFVR